MTIGDAASSSHKWVPPWDAGRTILHAKRESSGIIRSIIGGLLLSSIAARGASVVDVELVIEQTARGPLLSFTLPALDSPLYVRGCESPRHLDQGWLLSVIDKGGPHQVLATTAVNFGQMFFRLEAAKLAPPLLTNLVWVPSGTFSMGSATTERGRDDDEGPETIVTLTRGFWLGRFEVTQGEYAELVGTNPSYFNGEREGTNYGVDLNRPVEMVSWYDATNYCALLTTREQAAGRLPEGWAYRLPTEAEWEFACRAGTTGAFHFGTALTTNLANFDWRWEYDSKVGMIHNPAQPFIQRTLPVGSFPPSPFGLYDMHGNVWEWCLDWHTGIYPGGTVVDPTGPTTGMYKLLRGGGWHIFAWHCRSANRSIKSPWDRSNIRGFRVAMALNGKFVANTPGSVHLPKNAERLVASD